MYIVCLFVIYSLICLADAWWRCCMPYGVGKTSHIVAAYGRAADSHNWFLIPQYDVTTGFSLVAQEVKASVIVRGGGG